MQFDDERVIYFYQDVSLHFGTDSVPNWGEQGKQPSVKQMQLVQHKHSRKALLPKGISSLINLFVFHVQVSHKTRSLRQQSSGLLLACPNFLICFIRFPAHPHIFSLSILLSRKKFPSTSNFNFWMNYLYWIYSILKIIFSSLTVTVLFTHSGLTPIQAAPESQSTELNCYGSWTREWLNFNHSRVLT